MATLGPTLRADVAGSCPECEAGVLLDVDARELCLTELRFLGRVGVRRRQPDRVGATVDPGRDPRPAVARGGAGTRT